ncbi:MAG: peptidoglycan editing factor PgeF [Chlamydiales bacterium]
MERHVDNHIEWLTFDHLSACPKLIHGVFLRHGGVSQGEFSSLNFGLNQGDDPHAVAINRKRGLTILGIEDFTLLYQIHSNRVVEATARLQEEGDALITQKKKLGLLILHADCQAAIFYDPIHHALANVHAGWRGSVANIYGKTIQKMKDRYGTQPQDLLIGISPSLGPEAAQFIHYQNELPSTFWPYQIKPTYFDFWQISQFQLNQAGILSHHIEMANLCTYTHKEDFFSYRRCKQSGRHGTIAAIK